ncbi:MAG: TolC family outer membrane protein [Burkholderiales bacterium]|nr:TolC family outer membrane protein [Burkholderiales bacterium]MCE7877574.1 channel protein TolC [Betaproteobacteria bacterium PRO3]
MKRRLLALAVPLAFAALPAAGEDLMDIYREAQRADPVLAAARANWLAVQEKAPQARAGLLPNVGFSASVNANDVYNNTRSQPPVVASGNYQTWGATISATQPIYRVQNVVAYDQARRVVEQADFTLASAQQDLIIRVAVAYFDVLLAQFNVELSVAQKAAVSEQLAQAKRNFEVGVATITDTNEAQANYDQIAAQEIAARNDLDNKVTALRAIIGRMPRELKKLGPGFDPTPPEPNSLDVWLDRALKENLAVRVAQVNFDVATLEVDRQRAGHLPTLDLVGSLAASGANGSTANDLTFHARNAAIGLALNLPIYQGGFVDSKIREAVALQDSARDTLELARRNARFNAQVGYTGVNSSVATVRATAQAVQSAEVALQSNRLGQEVGVRTNLDVLNVQQAVFTQRRNLAQAYFAYLINTLRLKSAVGTLNELDLEELNRRLAG